MTQCYLYEVLVNSVVRYVGFGRRDRMYAHVRLAKRALSRLRAGLENRAQPFHLLLACALEDGASVLSRMVAQGMTSEEARRAEVLHIASFPNGQLWNSHPGGGGASAERMSALWGDPQWRARQMEALRASWQDPAYRAAMLEVRSDPNFRARISQAVSERFADPAERAKQSERTSSYYSANPSAAQAHGEFTKRLWAENHELFSKAVTAHWSDPAHRDRQSEAAKRQWSDPAGREKLERASREKWTPELRAWRSQKTREQFQDPGHREAMSSAAKARWADPRSAGR